MKAFYFYLSTTWAFSLLASLEPVTTNVGFVARLLINEVPFPGDPLFISENDSKNAMEEILWVLKNRTSQVPTGYNQWEIAGTYSHHLTDIITATHEIQGFYRTPAGQLAVQWHVTARIDSLLQFAHKWPTGTIAVLLDDAQKLSKDYFSGRMPGKDRFAKIRNIHNIPVTGFGYGWMTADLPFDPDGSFLAIPNTMGGLMGGNRFYTLRKYQEHIYTRLMHSRGPVPQDWTTRLPLKYN